MSTFIFGIQAHDVDEAAALAQQQLGIVFEARESVYLGGDYYRHVFNDRSSLSIRTNWDLLDDVPEEAAFPEVKVVMYAEGQEACAYVRHANVSPEIIWSLSVRDAD